MCLLLSLPFQKLDLTVHPCLLIQPNFYKRGVLVCMTMQVITLFRARVSVLSCLHVYALSFHPGTCVSSHNMLRWVSFCHSEPMFPCSAPLLSLQWAEQLSDFVNDHVSLHCSVCLILACKQGPRTISPSTEEHSLNLSYRALAQICVQLLISTAL